MIVVTNGAAKSAARSEWRTAHCFGTASANDEDEDDLEHRRHRDAERAEEPGGDDADERRRDELADEHEEQDRGEEGLGVLDEAPSERAPRWPLVDQRLRPGPRGPHEPGLGEREDGETRAAGRGPPRRGRASTPENPFVEATITRR